MIEIGKYYACILSPNPKYSANMFINQVYYYQMNNFDPHLSFTISRIYKAEKKGHLRNDLMCDVLIDEQLSNCFKEIDVKFDENVLRLIENFKKKHKFVQNITYEPYCLFCDDIVFRLTADLLFRNKKNQHTHSYLYSMDKDQMTVFGIFREKVKKCAIFNSKTYEAFTKKSLRHIYPF